MWEEVAQAEPRVDRVARLSATMVAVAAEEQVRRSLVSQPWRNAATPSKYNWVLEVDRQPVYRMARVDHPGAMARARSFDVWGDRRFSNFPEERVAEVGSAVEPSRRQRPVV